MKLFCNRFLLQTLICLIALFNIGCVGTVKEKNAPPSNISSSQGKSTPISFAGLARVTPISDTKIELFFYEANTAAEEVSYEVYVNNSSIPIKLSSKSTPRVLGGLLRFTVIGLEANTTYSFNMRAIPSGEFSSAKLDASKTLFTTTFKNETADFLGISSAETLAGVAGTSSIKLKWIPVVNSGLGRPTDPSYYEITSISEDAGIANINNPQVGEPDRKIIKLNSPSASETTITGLISGKKYYFQVRAIHLGYEENYSSNSSYRHEMNSRYAFATTLNSTTILDFSSPQISLSNIQNKLGLTSLNVNWQAAKGIFVGYRICYFKTNSTNVDLDNIVIGDNFSWDSLPSGVTCSPSPTTMLEASLTNYTIQNLESFSTYQVKVIACKTTSCINGERTPSTTINTKEVSTPIAQFNGISEIKNPTTYIPDVSIAADLKKLSISFSPLVKDTGYLTKLEVRCHGNSNLDNPGVEISSSGSAIGVISDGINNICSGLSLDTSASRIPAEISLGNSDSSFYNSRVNNVVIQLQNEIDDAKEYCFSLTPKIISNNVDKIIGQRIIKCSVPKLLTPTILSFTGKSNFGCHFDENGNKLKVQWNQVNSQISNSGIYSHYIVFWRKLPGNNDSFSFAEARDAYLKNDSTSYKWKLSTRLNLSMNLYTEYTDTLEVGAKFGVGVLPVLNVAGTTPRFGQDNYNIDNCAVSYPKATFDEWVDIFAVGPKENGLVPEGSSTTIYPRNILEKLDDAGIPIETTDGSTDPFDGIYGARNSDSTETFKQYSNSGIIRISWKEVSLKNKDTIHDHYLSESSTPKSNLKYGYRVYRSHDNQKTWINLTAAHNSSSNPNIFQTPDNAGLIRPRLEIDNNGILNIKKYKYKNLNNGPDVETILNSFTDYSVKSSASDGESDRARIYYYKIIPVFNGVELSYDQPENQNHHIIRVTLPPRNMALVHRLVANRTMCLELSNTIPTPAETTPPTSPGTYEITPEEFKKRLEARKIDKTASGHYSCKYNGIGSKGLTKPWVIGNTVVDQGGDLLVDRYELSCPFTRGTTVVGNDYSASRASPTTTVLNFSGVNSSGSNYRGCFHRDSNSTGATDSSLYDPARGRSESLGDLNYDKVLPGDCFGSDLPIQASNLDSNCDKPDQTRKYGFYYPGSNGSTQPCDTVPGKNYVNFLNISSPINTDTNVAPTQSEFGAVYYMRKAWDMNDSSRVPENLIGSHNGEAAVNTEKRALHYSVNGGRNSLQNSCVVNLPYKSGNGWRPRWIAINSLFGRLENASNEGIDLHDKTLKEITENANLYDPPSSPDYSDGKILAPTESEMNLSLRNITFDKTPLIRMITANSSKLPPLTGLSQHQFQQICSTYKVQVGIDTSTSITSTFNTIETQSKRLLRRSEFITSAAWPATYNEADVNNLESGFYNTRKTDDSASYKRGCNSSTRKRTDDNGTHYLLVGDSAKAIGQPFTPLFPHASRNNGIGYNQSTAKSTPFITGSSSGTDEIPSSEKCVSKYGIQDIVGNLQEVLSDEIFCDTEDLVMKFKSDPASAEGRTFDVTSNQLVSDYIAVIPSVNSGRCSLVNSKEDQNTSGFIDDSIMIDIKNWLGQFSSFIEGKNPKTYNHDQESILTARNGNGRFMSFGQNLFSVALTDDNALDYEATDKNLSYFNPIIGLPLTCEGDSCKDSGNQNDDNSLYRNPRNNTEKNDDSYVKNTLFFNNQFPINQSQFKNDGLKEVSWTDTTSTHFIADPVSIYSESNVESILYPTSPPEEEVSFAFPNWKVHRSDGFAKMKMYSGGGFSFPAGRYSLDLKGKNEKWEKDIRMDADGRCAVLINQN